MEDAWRHGGIFHPFLRAARRAALTAGGLCDRKGTQLIYGGRQTRQGRRPCALASATDLKTTRFSGAIFLAKTQL